MRIGVLALQGSFAEHIHSFRRLDVSATEVRLPQDLDGLHGLVIPGGESTTISRLLDEFGLLSQLSRKIAAGFPVWGTCAGMILLARRSTDMPLPTLPALDIAVKRNGWGRQVDSYETEIDVPTFGPPPFHAVFIRPPVVTDVGPRVSPLARTDDGSVVAVRQDNLLATAFHPELTTDLRFHDYFVQIIRAAGIEAAKTKDIALTTS
jgi:5'-phosphate synthase pdxT subunit